MGKMFKKKGNYHVTGDCHIGRGGRLTWIKRDYHGIAELYSHPMVSVAATVSIVPCGVARLSMLSGLFM